MIYLIGLLCILWMAAGFVVLHFALAHRTWELRIAGWLLVIGAAVALFFLFYWGPMAGGDKRSCYESHHQAQKEYAMRKKQCGMKEKAPAPADSRVLEAPPPPRVP